MNNRVKIILAFIFGFVFAMVYSYFYNMNGRYIPMRTKYSNVNISILDTRTGKIILYDDDEKVHSLNLIKEGEKEINKKK